MEAKTTNTVKGYFDQPEKYLHKEYGVRIRRELIGEATKGLAFEKILDMGCGNGTISLPFLGKDNHLTLVDLSENMLEVAKGYIPPELQANVTTQCSSLSDYKPGEKFDLVFAIGLLAHVPSLEEALLELRALLNNNGLLIVQFSDYGHSITRMHLASRNKSLHGLRKIEKKKFKELLNRAGLKIDKEIAYGNILPGMGRLPNSWLYSFIRMVSGNRLFSAYNSEYILLLKSQA